MNVIPIKRATLPRVVASGVIRLEPGLWPEPLPAVRTNDGFILLLEEPIPGMLGQNPSIARTFAEIDYLDADGQQQTGYCVGQLSVVAGGWITGEMGPVDSAMVKRCADLLVALAFDGIDGLALEAASS